MTLSQRDYKKMKKDVDEYGAYGIGFFEGIESKIPLYVWVDVVRKIGEEGWIRPGMTDPLIRQMLVTEAIRHINYQDFKALAPYLFSYPREQREKDNLVRPVEVSRSYFEELKANAQELFQVKQELVAIKEEQPKTLSELIAQVEEKEVIQETGYEVVGISQDRTEFLVLDNRPSDQRQSDLGDLFLEDDRLINDYRKTKSDQAQILDAILQKGSQKVLDYVYTFYNDNYREATGDLEGLEAVANYLLGDGLSPALLDEVETTSQMWQIAQESATFKQDYQTLDAFLDDYDMYDYMMDNADQIVNYPEHIAHINDLLEKDGKAVMVTAIKGYNQEEEWFLGSLYETKDFDQRAIDFFLTHEAGAAYKRSLTEAVVIDKQNLEQLGLEDAVLEGHRYAFDQEFLWGDRSKLEVLQIVVGRDDFSPLEAVMSQQAEHNQVKTADMELER